MRLRYDDLHKATVQTFHERYDHMGNRKGGEGDHLEVIKSRRSWFPCSISASLEGACSASVNPNPNPNPNPNCNPTFVSGHRP